MTKTRQVRITDDVWARAQARARAEGISVSQVMRDAVIAYAAVVDPDDYGRDWYAVLLPAAADIPEELRPFYNSALPEDAPGAWIRKAMREANSPEE